MMNIMKIIMLPLTKLDSICINNLKELEKLIKREYIYIYRFKELVFLSFYLDGDHLYFIKKSDTTRLDTGEFEDIKKVILKKYPLFLKY